MSTFSKGEKRFRWKGKVVIEKFYKRKIELQEIGRATRKNNDKPQDKSGEASTKVSDAQDEPFPVKGERLIDLEFMARFLKCRECNGNLLLENIKKEIRRGMKSILHVECHSCLFINIVPTGRRISENNENPHFQLNYKVAMGIIHTGISYQKFDKFCACIDMPSMSRNTFKYYEQPVGGTIEQVAQESCDKAITIEKELTVKNFDKIKKISVRSKISYL